jgi:predicted O-methyltransferase YrrM
MSKKRILRVADILLAPAVYIAAFLLRNIRRLGLKNLPLSTGALFNIGVFPIRRHFYDPQFDHRRLRFPLDQPRDLPGIDWNVEEQLQLLASFSYADELKARLLAKDDEPVFHFDNKAFEPGDAEYLYSLIRLKKPARVFEIGSGHSSRVVMKAVKRNRKEDAGYTCKHLCIEPYGAQWLEAADVTVIRQEVENVDRQIFSELASGDLLFIDSTHMIKPQGDVLFEYLEVLPTLQRGVIVHAHDIFTPRDYPREWIVDDFAFWNEQYLLEAFLSCNSHWKILGALNFLHHDYFEQLQEKCPFLTRDSIPGSFYFQRVS